MKSLTLEKGPKRHYKFPDGKELIVGERTLIMGILNVTPDSFSDGGKYFSIDSALRQMEALVAGGASIIDVGAESSRPGFSPMSADDELERLCPFLEKILAECPVPVSVDTFKSKTADTAIGMGAHILNDIWGLQYKKEPSAMAAVAARKNCPIIVMHNQAEASYPQGLIPSMQAFFRESLTIARKAGVQEKNIILDPGIGIGFGKTVQDNLTALRALNAFTEIDGKPFPLLLAASRKSFIGETLALPVEERDEATAAVSLLGMLTGAQILRVHDVKGTSRLIRMAEVLLGDEANG